MKKKMPSLTKFIIFSFAVLIIYLVVEFIVSTMTGISHDTLTQSVFLVWGGEVLSCALIKVFKLREENKDE